MREGEEDEIKEDEACGQCVSGVGLMRLHPLLDIWFSSEKAERRGSLLAGLISYSAV